MPATGWYYTRGPQRFGPVSADELRQLAEHGELGPDEWLWREGMEQWLPARRVKGLFDQGGLLAAKDSPAAASTPMEPEATEPAPPVEAISPSGNPVAAGAARTTFESSPSAFERAREGSSRQLFDWLIESLRPVFNVEFVRATEAMFAWIGHGVLYAATVLFLGIGVALAVEHHSPAPALIGIAVAAILAVLQYSSGRFAGALERVDKSAASHRPSAVFLDSFALLSFVGGLSSLVGLTVFAVTTGDFGWIPPAVIVFILLQHLGMTALNPETLHLTVNSECTAGEEALGILSFVIKLGLRAVAVVFGVGTLWGGVLIGYTIYLLAEPAVAPHARLDLGPDFLTQWLVRHWSLPPAEITALVAGALIIVSAAFPLLAYVGFAMSQLVIELLRAVLALPTLPESYKDAKKTEELP